MWIIYIIVGVTIGWLIPQPQLQWGDDIQKVGVLTWVWRWVRDKAGMN